MGRAYEVRKASIQKTGAVKAKIYSTYAKEIYSAARNGGFEINSNPTLKRLVEKAKREQVPGDIIERAINKAKGNDNINYETVYYECFGPGTSTLVIKCLTDNINRTISYIREACNKAKTKMGSQGSVSYNYDHLAILTIKNEKSDELFETILNNSIEIIDYEVEENEITISMKPNDKDKVKDVIETIIPAVDYLIDEVGMYAKDKVDLNDEELAVFNKFVGLLENIEDISEIYHNVNLK